MTEERDTLKAEVAGLVAGLREDARTLEDECRADGDWEVYRSVAAKNTRIADLLERYVPTDTLTDSGADVERVADIIGQSVVTQPEGRYRIKATAFREELLDIAQKVIAALRSTPNEQPTAE